MTRLCTCAGSYKSTADFYKKRNKLAEASCKTCGGNFLVDGIGTVSGNMLSSVGLEVAKSLNPELSWKAVTKGRRSRKSVARNLNEGMKVVNRSPKRVGDFSGSDSDKIAEAASRPGDKVEHVPIKKRRHLLESSSLQSHVPSTDSDDSLTPQSLATAMRSEDCKQIPVYNHSSDQWSSDSYSSRDVLAFERKTVCRFDDRVLDAKISKIADGKLYNSEDFSGIALLAAAACINGMDDDLDNGKETHAIVTSAAPGKFAGSTSSHSKEILDLKESTEPSRGDIAHASNTKSSTVNEPAVAAEGFAELEEHSAVNRSLSPKVDRIHWDLNTSMDAWVQPLEDAVIENAFDKGLNDDEQMEKVKTEVIEKTRDFEDYEQNSGKCASPDKNGATSKPADVNAESYKPESLAVHDRICGEEKVFGDLGNSCTKTLGSVSAGVLVSEECLIMKQSESSIKVAGFCKAATSEVPFLAKPSCGSAPTCNDSSVPTMTSEVPVTSILNTLGVRSSENNPTEASCCNHSSKWEELSAAKASIAGGKLIEQRGIILAADSPMQLEGKEVISKLGDSITSTQLKKCTTSATDSSRSSNEGLQIDDSSQFTKISPALEESHNSDISQEDRSQMIGQEHMTANEAGYESPFEDGELRGSVMYCWEDNEIEDGENECVDYESDGRDGVDSDAADHPASEIVEAGSEGSQCIEKRISSTSGCPEVDFVKGGSPRNFPRRQFNRDDNSIVDSGGNKVLGTVSGSSTQRSGDKLEGSESFFRKGLKSDHIAAFEFRGSYTGEIGSKTNGGKLHSRIEGPLYLDEVDGKSAALKYQNRPHNIIGSYHRPEREVSPDKFNGRYRAGYNSRDRGARDDQWNSWNSRSSYQSDNHGHESHSYTRRRSYADSADKFNGVDSRDHRQSINYSSEGVRRPLIRRRPSVERDDYYDGNRRMVPVRGGYRSRGGAGSFSQRFGRGSREGYEPIPVDADLSSVRVPQYLPRGERSGSPASGRAARMSLPRRRSRSRSRTRSPHPWHAQRERNFSARRHSRSPDLRSEARLDRTRMPFRKPGFSAEYGEDFSSSPRGHCPPERSSRWIDDRSFGDDHSRQKWSPLKVIRRSQKFDSVGVSGRNNSDEYRPMMRPGRFDSMSGRGRGHKFDPNYEEKRRDDRFEMIHRIRDSDPGAGVRRFQPDTREGFEAGNSHSEEDVQSTDRRDVSRTVREDKRPFKT